MTSSIGTNTPSEAEFRDHLFQRHDEITTRLRTLQRKRDYFQTQVKTLEQLVRDQEARYVHRGRNTSRQYYMKLKISATAGLKNVYEQKSTETDRAIHETRRELIDELISTGRASGYDRLPEFRRQIEQLIRLSRMLRQRIEGERGPLNADGDPDGGGEVEDEEQQSDDNGAVNS